MSVYIKDMELPKCCRLCRFIEYPGIGEIACAAQGKLMDFDDDEIFKPWKHRHHGCPLIDIPDGHGGLVDASDLYDFFCEEGQRSKRYKLGETWELNGYEIRKVIDELPILIPAERKE